MFQGRKVRKDVTSKSTTTLTNAFVKARLNARQRRIFNKARQTFYKKALPLAVHL